MLELAQLDRQERLPPDQAVTLDELVTMVSYAERLAIFFARCNAPVLRDRLIAEAIRLLVGKGIRVVTASVPPDTANVRAYLRAQLASAQNGAGDRMALFVTDLEHSLPYDRPDSPVLTELNMGRELFHRDLPVPIVFWLPDYALTIVARQAPDFWAWRSGVFDFTLDPLYRQQVFQEYVVRDGDSLSVDNMTAAQKQQRRRTLEGLLDEYGRLSDVTHGMEERTELLYRLAQVTKSLYDLPRAIEYLHQYLAAVRRDGDREQEVRALREIGVICYQLGDLRQAVVYFENALDISREIGDRKREGDVMGLLGLALMDNGDFQGASGFFERALAVSREVGNRRGEVAWLANVGNAHFRIGDWDSKRTIGYYEQALASAREMGDRRIEGVILGNLGNALRSLGSLQGAIVFTEQALAISRELGDRGSEGAWLGQLGNVYRELGDSQRAISFFEDGLAISREVGDRQREGRHLLGLGEVYAQIGDYPAARRVWQQALVVFQDIESFRTDTARALLAHLPE